jgi:hypothetical protein
VNQAAEKVSIRVPAVKPGDYNVSIQVGNNIFIQPIWVETHARNESDS